MPVSGLVVVLSERGADAHAARSMIQGAPDLEVGVEEVARRLPVVMDTATRRESRDMLERLQKETGVVYVEVVYVDFGDEQQGRT